MQAILNRARVRRCLREFDLRSLFIDELGWDYGGTDVSVVVSEIEYQFEAVAQKRGMVAYQYKLKDHIDFPDHTTRKQIENAISRIVREHLTIYKTNDGESQYWQWIKKDLGGPARSRIHIHHKIQSGERLIQKLERLLFTLEDEEDLTIVDVTGRIRAAFDVENVTKKFYDRFEIEHSALLDLIEGINTTRDREWYASLMLNRLMFLYFIQKRGFLDNDIDYLCKHLERISSQSAERQLVVSYHEFLRILFYEGLNKPTSDRDKDITRLLGRVPYLNGGLFEAQLLEIQNDSIFIPDRAFNRIFKFFDDYQWHLDDRALRNDNEINPDVLGYIFEKFVNRKLMGAYYTKEDITEYISRNTIVPFLFDQVKGNCPKPFEARGEVWSLLSIAPERYFFDSMRHGITLDEVESLDFAEIRAILGPIDATLDDQTPAEYGLPNESWREYIDRRKRYERTYDEIERGRINSINDLITRNLDIEKFAQDVLATSKDPELILAFWNALNEISVLDPACGSGAFLFAALNVLEPLYVGCLDAMQGFVEEDKNSAIDSGSELMRRFHKILRQVSKHEDERYFVLKSIIVNNLYGVDIMKEATEICKLRLFLKLVAQLHDYHHIEPLPDIDFNVRSGNSIVGYTSMTQLEYATSQDIIGKLSVPDIQRRAELVDQSFEEFRKTQITNPNNVVELGYKKDKLRQRLKELRTQLDRSLANQYGVRPHDQNSYRQWLASHLPFHWFIEFNRIMRDGGFDVVIGNPPYISANKIRKEYDIMDYSCEKCPDIYAWFLERTKYLLKQNGRTGMIVPLSIGFSNDFAVCRQLLTRTYGMNWYSSFGRIPSALFNFDVRVRNTIHLGYKTEHTKENLTSRLHRWYEAERKNLFEQIQYIEFDPVTWDGRIPKVNTQNLTNVFEALLKVTPKGIRLHPSRLKTPYILHFKQSAYNWLNFCREVPPSFNKKGKRISQTQFGKVYFRDEQELMLTMLLANGKLMLAYWLMVGDDFHLTQWNFKEFPINLDKLPEVYIEKLMRLVPILEEAMKDNVQYKLNAGKRVGNYNLGRCREITDRSDAIFSEILGIEDSWDEIELYLAQSIRTDIDPTE